MINTGYSSHQLLSLFGRQGGTQPVGDAAAKNVAELAKRAEAAIAAERKAQASPAPSAPASSAPTATSDAREETWEGYERRAEAARAVLAQREAVEKAFAAENGWERKATPASVSAYNQAIAREAPAYGLGSHKEAAEFASRMVDNVWRRNVEMNRATATLADPAQVEQVAQGKELSATQATAMLKDTRLAESMTATVETMVFDKTFEVTGGPLMAGPEGARFINNVEVRHEGRLVLTVEGHGEKVRTYDGAGQVLNEYALGGFEQFQPPAA